MSGELLPHFIIFNASLRKRTGASVTVPALVSIAKVDQLRCSKVRNRPVEPVVFRNWSPIPWRSGALADTHTKETYLRREGNDCAQPRCPTLDWLSVILQRMTLVVRLAVSFRTVYHSILLTLKWIRLVIEDDLSKAKIGKVFVVAFSQEICIKTSQINYAAKRHLLVAGLDQTSTWFRGKTIFLEQCYDKTVRNLSIGW